jgi:hypothetical protein
MVIGNFGHSLVTWLSLGLNIHYLSIEYANLRNCPVIIFGMNFCLICEFA